MRVTHRIGPAMLLALLAAVGACRDSDPPTAPTYSISGTVNGAGAGVSVRVAGPDTQTVSTDAAGVFHASGLRPGPYTVTPTQPGSIFDPVERAVTIAAADVTAQVFTRQQPSEGLTAEDMQRIDAAPESFLPPDSVILPNGQTLAAYVRARGLDGPLPSLSSTDPQLQTPVTGPQQRRNDIIGRMLYAADQYACGRRPTPCTRWDHEADPTDPVNRPAQRGLTYVYGGRAPTVRTLPKDGCPQMTFGMDCSGLIIKIAQAAGLTAPAASGPQADPDAWNIPEEWQVRWKRVTDGTIHSGDLVYWPGHIGIAETSGSGGSVKVISATGRPGACATNIAPPRGPRSLSISALGLGTPSRVLRLVTTLSGDFDLYIRCSDRDTDAAVIRFTIDNDGGGPFRAVGTGVDYDGSPLSFVLEGTYDQDSNVLEATLSLADGSRVDGLRVTLLEDATDYFPLAKVVDNGGCVASARLVRVAAPGQAASPPRLLQRAAPVPGGPRLGGPPRGP